MTTATALPGPTTPDLLAPFSAPPADVTLLGISGYARSGKDTLGRIVQSQLGYVPVAFADALKRVAEALDPRVPTTTYHPHATVPLHSYLQRGGWEDAKTKPGVREFLQNLGVACRTYIGPDVWINALLDNLPSAAGMRYVVTDVRFPNEADAIRQRGGQVWRLERPGTGPANSHTSETALDNYGGFSRTIINDGSISDLRAKVLNP